MFGWLKKNKPRQVSAEKIAQEMTRIVHTYVALLKEHPNHFMDVSWLPADKQKMIEVFKISWLAGNNEMREEVENWWCLLSRFQAGVGSTPISYEISKDNPAVKEWYKRQERVEPLLNIATAENEIYEREIERFKVSNKMRH